MANLNGSRYRTAGARWPEAALSNAFVRNISDVNCCGAMRRLVGQVTCLTDLAAPFREPWR